MKKPLVITISVIVAVVVAICIGGAISQIIDSGPNAVPDAGVRPVVSLPSAPYQGVSPQPEEDAGAITKSEIQLSVKITKKECFGSAGCNVEYKIKAATDTSKVKRLGKDWDVTYEVKGFDDGTQTGTLTLHPDGTYSQDDYQSGSIARSSSKLTVKVTDLEEEL